MMQFVWKCCYSLVYFTAAAEARAQCKGEGHADGHREHHHPDPILVHGHCNSRFSKQVLGNVLKLLLWLRDVRGGRHSARGEELWGAPRSGIFYIFLIFHWNLKIRAIGVLLATPFLAPKIMAQNIADSMELAHYFLIPAVSWLIFIIKVQSNYSLRSCDFLALGFLFLYKLRLAHKNDDLWLKHFV